jgi:putative addiction module component (TIGR02574 family)
MSPTTAELFKAAQALPEAERIELASALWETIEDDGEDGAVELSPEWRAEIAERMRAIDAGEVTLLSEEEVNNRLREKYGPLFD